MASRREALPDISGARPSYGPGAAAAPAFLRFLVISLATALVGLFFAASPVGRESVENPAAASPAGPAAAAASPATPAGPIGPHTAAVLSLYEGPSADYPVLATLPRGASLEVIGRSEDGAWLALSVAPHSPLYGWAARGDVIDAPANESLPLKPVVLIDAP